MDFRTSTTRVPPRLFELPPEYAAAYLHAFGDDEGTVHDTHIDLYSSNRELLQDIYDLVQAKFPELGAFAVFTKKPPRSNPAWRDMYDIRFRVGALASYRALIGFTHPEKKQELDQILACKNRNWTHRTYGITRRMLLVVLATTSSMTAKALARKVHTIVQNVRDPHLKGLIAWGVVRVQKTETGPYGAKLFEITDRGRKFLQLPPIGLLSGYTGRTKVAILKTLDKGRLRAKEIGQQLGKTKGAIYNQMRGANNRGKWTPGLLELGLVERCAGRRNNRDPNVYCLTTKGRRMVETLETLFPAQFGAD